MDVLSSSLYSIHSILCTLEVFRKWDRRHLRNASYNATALHYPNKALCTNPIKQYRCPFCNNYVPQTSQEFQTVTQ